MILFVKNEKSVEMSNIGVVKYKNVGSIDLKDLKQIDITDIVNGGSRIQVYPHDDRTYCLLFVDVGTPSYPIYQFKKHKNKFFIIHYHSYNRYNLAKLNLDLEVANTVNISNISYTTPFLSVNDAHIYTYFNNQLYIYNNELQFLKQVGQSNNPTGAFYLPTDIKQFESHKGM